MICYITRSHKNENITKKRLQIIYLHRLQKEKRKSEKREREREIKINGKSG